MGDKDTRDGQDGRYWDATERARELLDDAEYQEAFEELKKLIREDRNNPYAFSLLGSALWELGHVEGSRDAYRACVKLAPSYLGARVGLSHTLRKLKDFAGAEREARVALASFPGDPDALHALGLALAGRGRRHEAKKSLEGFLAKSPQFEAATEVRGILEMLGLGEEGDPLEVE
jgi:Flp pilus assembly protein TadD